MKLLKDIWDAIVNKCLGIIYNNIFKIEEKVLTKTEFIEIKIENLIKSLNDKYTAIQIENLIKPLESNFDKYILLILLDLFIKPINEIDENIIIYKISCSTCMNRPYVYQIDLIKMAIYIKKQYQQSVILLEEEIEIKKYQEIKNTKIMNDMKIESEKYTQLEKEEAINRLKAYFEGFNNIKLK